MRICVPITANNTRQFILDIQTAQKSQANILELRLDFVRDLSEFNLQEILQSCQLPKIITIRIAAEGGQWQGTEEQRLIIFQKAIEFGAEFIDVELQSSLRPRGTKLILSYHNFNETPALKELQKIYHNMHEQGADIAKIVSTAKSNQDNWEIYKLLSQTQDDSIIAIAMGELGQPTRISGPSLGSYLTFATVPGLSTSAPGQLAIKEIKKQLKNIVLIGGRASGKSAVSHQLAKKTGKFTVSTDDMIVARSGMDIPTIIEKQGWPYFRQLELQILKQFANLEGVVIDCGGGILCDQEQDGTQTLSEENIKLLKTNSQVFWLHCPLSVQSKRLGSDPNRPSLTGLQSAQQELKKIMELRNPWYARAADHTIDTSKNTPQKVVAKILTLS